MYQTMALIKANNTSISYKKNQRICSFAFHVYRTKYNKCFTLVYLVILINYCKLLFLFCHFRLLLKVMEHFSKLVLVLRTNRARRIYCNIKEWTNNNTELLPFFCHIRMQEWTKRACFFIFKIILTNLH